MKQHQFTLQPFLDSISAPNLQIQSTVLCEFNCLKIDYQVFGDLNQVQIKPPIDTPTRQHQLWQNTCFEFFVAMPNSSAYWEFNLAPSGNWNVYAFDDYRQGMREEKAFTFLPFQFQQKSDRILVQIDVNLESLKINSQNLEIALTTVIQHRDGKLSYWALKHTGKEADFHRRDSFVKIKP